jgi:hypothetical protein
MSINVDVRRRGANSIIVERAERAGEGKWLK